jgi:hypothetical protein
MACQAKRTDVHGRLLYLKYSHEDRCSAWREGERRLIVQANHAKPQSAKVTKAFCDDNFLRIAPNPPNLPDSTPSDFFFFGYLKKRLQSKDSNWDLQMNFFGESQTFWTKSALTLCKHFSGSRSTNWTDALQHCSIAALQHCSITALQHCSIAALE